jgi:hypothetical protein
MSVSPVPATAAVAVATAAVVAMAATAAAAVGVAIAETYKSASREQLNADPCQSQALPLMIGSEWWQSDCRLFVPVPESGEY